MQDVSLCEDQVLHTPNPDILCCKNKKMSTIFLIIFGLGAFVGFVDYFLVKDDLQRKSHHDKQYLRSSKIGVPFDSTYENYLAYYGKSYPTKEDFDKRKINFEQARAEILRIQAAEGSNATFEMELNEFADMTENEFQTFWTGGKPLDERIDTSIFYDFETEEEIDNLYVKKYLDQLETDPHFKDGHGTLDESISELVPNNHYGPIGDEVLDNPYDDIGKLSEQEADQLIRDGQRINDDSYLDIGDEHFVKLESVDEDQVSEQDGFMQVNPLRRLSPRVQEWPWEPIKPMQLDWRNQGAVSRVKRQGRCGACWAIAAAASLEGAYAIQSGKLKELSEQQIMDCSSREPFRSAQCDGGYISEALSYAKTTLIATRENYPYLGFNNSCRKIRNEDIVNFKDVPNIKTQVNLQNLMNFWTNFYIQKFQHELIPIHQGTDNKVKRSEEIYENFLENINFVTMLMDEYQIPISADDHTLDSNHQWSFNIQYKANEDWSSLFYQPLLDTSPIYIDEVTKQMFTGEKNPTDVTTVRATKFYRLWQSSPRKLKKALKKGPVTVMVHSNAPVFKYYKQGIIDSKECTPDVDHAVLAVGYGTYTNSEGKLDDYFILKNSWGKYWGEQGYARITANRSKFGKGMCGIYVESYIPSIETDQQKLQKFREELQ